MFLADGKEGYISVCGHANIMGDGKILKNALKIENVMKTCKPGEMVLLAGRPGSGMTDLAAEMAEYLVSEEKQGVIFSLYNMKNKI